VNDVGYARSILFIQAEQLECRQRGQRPSQLCRQVSFTTLNETVHERLGCRANGRLQRLDASRRQQGHQERAPFRGLGRIEIDRMGRLRE
jgi:hypothetical protein